MNSEFDKNEIYDSEIQPLVSSIANICRREKLPFFLSVMVSSTNNGEETTAGYRREAVIKELFGYDISNDEIGSHLAVAQGFPVDFERPIEISVMDDQGLWDMIEEDFWEE